MKMMSIADTQVINGGWYWGAVYCPSCGKKMNPSIIQRMICNKSQLESQGYAAHYGNMTRGSKVLH